MKINKWYLQNSSSLIHQYPEDWQTSLLATLTTDLDRFIGGSTDDPRVIKLDTGDPYNGESQRQASQEPTNIQEISNILVHVYIF